MLKEKDKEPVPLEVELMRRVCRAPTCPGIIQLLDWFVGPSVVILVLERPLYCTDLQVYIKSKPGGLNESKARRIFRQVVEVMWHCQSRGVFHNDLKAENILIQRKSKQIKLIDFGCGFILQDEAYKKLRGTVQNFPPEVFRKKCYKAVPATSWSLGLLLFNMLCGDKPFASKKEILQGIFQYKRFISRGTKAPPSISLLINRHPPAHSHHFLLLRLQNPD
ncbi:serine/threonine-protein kinase pim-2-like [Erpetoichthys calabaricus]|uniref:serine/threonine-protein kinase pim-2-like n=1 Tax=Erpetoichthys calabaricus TaxID=27687 RepID=UPI002234334F|nr:serine/threonine-protein kinase pim-2-like [Erpetoichthys calabaricus]